MSKHLWEVDHPYYCSEGNYFERGCHAAYSRWQDFIAEQGDCDLDMNLVFRFDCADEPPVKEWLKVRWDHMKLLWEPLSC